MRSFPPLTRCRYLGVALLLMGCPSDPGEVSDGDSGSGSSDSTGGGSDPGATSVVSGQGTADGTTAADADTSDGGMDSVGFITAGMTDEGTGGPQPNGGLCQDDGECQSGFCLTLDGPAGGLGGVCSECKADADCEMGTCDFAIDIGYAVCTDGSAGVDCDSDDGCADGLVCVQVFDAGGFSPTRCSECGPDDPCPDGQGCILDTSNGLLDAYLACVDLGTVPLGEPCPVVDGVGDGSLCQSTECAVISIFMGSVEIGICSECDSDADCMGGQVCNPPGFSMGMLTPGTCG